MTVRVLSRLCLCRLLHALCHWLSGTGQLLQSNGWLASVSKINRKLAWGNVRIASYRCLMPIRQTMPEVQQSLRNILEIATQISSWQFLWRMPVSCPVCMTRKWEQWNYWPKELCHFFHQLNGNVIESRQSPSWMGLSLCSGLQQTGKRSLRNRSCMPERWQPCMLRQEMHWIFP